MGRSVSRILVFLVLLYSGMTAAVEIGDPAPPWSLTSHEGTEIDFPRVAEGKPAVLFFWATWCPYCHAVMPHLQQIREDYAEFEVEIYAIDFKDDGDPVAHIQELGYDFVVLPAGDLVADEYGVIGAPGLMVVDQRGIIAYSREPTEGRPNLSIADQWNEEIRTALDRLVSPEAR